MIAIKYNIVLVPGKLKKLELTAGVAKIDVQMGLMIVPESTVDIRSINEVQLEEVTEELDGTSVNLSTDIPTTIKNLTIDGTNFYSLNTGMIGIGKLFQGVDELCWKNNPEEAFKGDFAEGMGKMVAVGKEVEFLQLNIQDYASATEEQQGLKKDLAKLHSLETLNPEHISSRTGLATAFLRTIQTKREVAAKFEEIFDRIYLEDFAFSKNEDSLNYKKMFNVLVQEPELMEKLGFVQFFNVHFEIERSALNAKENIFQIHEWFEINAPKTPAVSAKEKVNTICSLIKKNDNEFLTYVGANRERKDGVEIVNRYGLMKVNPRNEVGKNLITVLLEHPINDQNRNSELINKQELYLNEIINSKEETLTRSLMDKFFENSDVKSTSGMHIFFNNENLFPKMFGHPSGYSMKGHVPLVMHKKDGNNKKVYSLSYHKAVYEKGPYKKTVKGHGGVEMNVAQETNDGVALAMTLMYKWTGNNFAVDFFRTHESNADDDSSDKEREEKYIEREIASKDVKVLEGTNLPLLHGQSYAFSCVENPMFSSLYIDEEEFKEVVDFDNGLKPLTINGLDELFPNEFFSNSKPFFVDNEINPPALIPHDIDELKDDNSSQIIFKQPWDGSRVAKTKKYQITPPKGDVELCTMLGFFSGNNDSFNKKFKWLKKATQAVPRKWKKKEIPFLIDPRVENVKIRLQDSVVKDGRKEATSTDREGSFKNGDDKYDYSSLNFSIQANKKSEVIADNNILLVNNDDFSLTLNPGAVEGFEMWSDSSNKSEAKPATAKFRVVNAVATYEKGDLPDSKDEFVSIDPTLTLKAGGYQLDKVTFGRNHQVAGAVQLLRTYTDVQPSKVDVLEDYSEFAKRFREENSLNNHVRKPDTLNMQFDPMNVYELEEVFGKEIKDEVIVLQDKTEYLKNKKKNGLSEIEEAKDEIVQDAFPLPYSRLNGSNSTTTSYQNVPFKDDERGKRQTIFSKTYSRHLNYYKNDIEKEGVDFNIQEKGYFQEVLGGADLFIPYNATYAHASAELIPDKIAFDVKLLNYQEESNPEIFETEFKSQSYFMIEFNRKHVNKYCNEELYAIVLDDLFLANDFTTSDTASENKGKLEDTCINFPLKLIKKHVLASGESKEMASGVISRKIELKKDRHGTVVKRNGKNAYLLIEPHFLYAQDKVFSIFNLNESLRIDNLNNPFLKISMVRMTKKTDQPSLNSDDYHISDPSEPQFIQIQSKRHIHVKKDDHEFVVQIKDDVERNKVSNGFKRSQFYVALSDRIDNDLLRTYKDSTYESGSITGKKKTFHPIEFDDNNTARFKLSREGAGSKVLNIFEFEEYKNTGEMKETLDPLNDPRFKLIFSNNYRGT